MCSKSDFGWWSRSQKLKLKIDWQGLNSFWALCVRVQRAGLMNAARSAWEENGKRTKSADGPPSMRNSRGADSSGGQVGFSIRNRRQSQQIRGFLQYTEQASWLRVISVCSFAFTPSFAFAILIELLPLRPASEGWQANWVFWIRLFLSCCVLSFGIGIQTTLLIPAAGLTTKHAVFIALGASLGYVLQLISVAALWRFPVPFAILVGSPAWQLSVHFCAVAAIGVKKAKKDPAIKTQSKATRPLTNFQTALILIYPVYNAIFIRLHGFAQLAFILVLPVMKIGMGKLLVRATKAIPAARAFGIVTVELFDALYLFKCMQTAGSLLSGLGLITVDLIQNIHHIRHLSKRVQRVKQDLEKVGSGDYKAAIRSSMSRMSSNLNNQLIDISSVPSSGVVPIQAPKKETASPEASKTSSQIKLDRNVQTLLLECERIIVIEFIECAVPMYYALYMAILFHLPNAKFYPEMERLDAAQLKHTVSNIALYALLEFISLMYMHFLLYWKFNISGLHLLANMLERESAMLQGVFMTWVIIVLQLTVQHGGVDFSFKFQ